MTTMYTIDKLNTIVFNYAKRRKEVSKLIISNEKIPFSAPIVKYNRYMRESDKNAQQRAYYSSHRLESRY